MIDWILRELEKQPSTLFYEKELTARDASEFARLKHEKLLAYVQPDDRSETYGFGQPKPLTVVKVDGELYGINDEDPEVDPVSLKRADLARYRFSLERFIDKLRAANNLLGPKSEFDKRLFIAGEKATDGKRVAFVFALLDSEKRARDLLLSLPSLLPDNFDRVVVVTPSFSTASLDLRSHLDRARISVWPLDDAINLKVDVSGLLKEVPRLPPPVSLKPEQEAEFALYGYKSRLPVYITVDTKKRGANIVKVGDTRVPIGDAPFALFLRLVLELKTNKIGTVSKSILFPPTSKKADSGFQAIHRLRQEFRNTLGGLAPEQFIEVLKPKTLRLSTHPALVTYDKERLLRHDNEKIRRLASKLP